MPHPLFTVLNISALFNQRSPPWRLRALAVNRTPAAFPAPAAVKKACECETEPNDHGSMQTDITSENKPKQNSAHLPHNLTTRKERQIAFHLPLNWNGTQAGATRAPHSLYGMTL